MDLKISIIIPCYNSETMISKCLDSISEQTLKEIEIICVDDGSTDQILNILNDYAQKDSRITILNQENQFAGVARNNGMSKARGKYLYFMDSDDYLALDALEKLYIRIEEDNADICTFGMGAIDVQTGELAYTSPLRKGFPKELPFSHKDIGDNIFSVLHSRVVDKLYKKSFIEASGVRFPSIQRNEDAFFSLATIIEAKRITAVDEWLYTRTINTGTSLTQTMDGNPYTFVDFSRLLKAHYVELGLYERYEIQIINRSIFPALHVLTMLKTQEKFLEVLQYLKEEFFPGLGIEKNEVIRKWNYNGYKNVNFIIETPLEELTYVRYNAVTKLLEKEVKVSVVLPCYNSEPFIEKCLDSVLNQTLQEIEVICVDDGSEDHTLSILKKYEEKDARVTVLIQENMYAGVARNNGMTIAKGKYIYFMDSDDFLEREALEKVYLKSEKDGADVCIFGAGTLDLETEVLNYAYPIKDIVPKKLPFSIENVGKQIMIICHLAPWNRLYKKSFIDMSGLKYQELQRSNDSFFCQTTMIEAERITVVDEWLYTRTTNSGTSLVETMDDNPYPFYESLKQTKQYFIEKEMYEEYEFELLKRCIYSSVHVISKLKTKEKLTEVLKFIKEICLPEFGFKKYFEKLPKGANSTKNAFFIMETPTEMLEEVEFNHEIGVLERELKVSVIIPCYNAERFLGECLDSLLNQTLKGIEIICVDDGSTDNTRSILDAYVQKDLRFKYLTQQNQFAGVARNKGMEIAKGEYLAFLDADDFFEPTMLEEMYKKSKEDNADLCISGGSMYDVRTGEVSYKYRVNYEFLPSKTPFSWKDIEKNIFSVGIVAPWGKLYKKSFIEENHFKFQALERANDFFFTQSALVSAERITVVDKPLFTYRTGTSTSLVETMDSNPLCFYEAKIALREFLIERELYDNAKIRNSFKRTVLSAAKYTLSMLKNKEVWLDSAIFFKEQLIPEFDLDKDRSYLNNYLSDTLNFLTKKTVEELNTYEPELRVDESFQIEEIENESPSYLSFVNSLILDDNPLKVSVILPVYNGENYIKNCLESILNQTLSDIEVICINDGSTDNTLEILENIVEKDKRVTLLNQENLGQSLARNAGLDIAKGEYVMFVDSDDQLISKSLERLYKNAKYYDLDDLLCDGEVFFDPFDLYEKKKSQLNTYKHRNDFPIATGRQLIRQMIIDNQFKSSICTRLFKRSFLEKHSLRFINCTIHEEKTFSLHSLNVAQRAMVLREPLYFIRMHSHSLKANSFERFVGWAQAFNAALKLSDEIELGSECFKLANQYKKFMIEKFDEIRQAEPTISNEMLSVIGRLLLDNKLDKTLQIKYAFYILQEFRINKEMVRFETDKDFQERITLLYNALKCIEHQTLNNILDKANTRLDIKHIILNFKETGNITEISEFYSMVVDVKDVIAKDKEGNVLEKLSIISADITLFKSVGSAIKLSGKFDTLINLTKFDLYWENDKKEIINLKLESFPHDQTKILGIVVKQPLSFLCYLPEKFLSNQFSLFAKYKDNPTIIKKLTLDFNGEHSVIQSEIQGSHLMQGNGLLYYNKNEKSLCFTKDADRIKYLELVNIMHLTQNEFEFKDLSLPKELQPYLKKRYEKKDINLFIATEGVSNFQIESLIKYHDKHKGQREKNYLVINRDSPNYGELAKYGISILNYDGLNPLKLLLVAKKVILYKPNKRLISSLEKLQEVLIEPFEIIEPWNFVKLKKIQKSVQEEFSGKTVNLFMDFVNKADNNSIALIEYFEKNKNVNEYNYFVLKKSSENYEYLLEKGLNVVQYRSFEHLTLLMVADKLISSEAQKDNFEPFRQIYGNEINYFFNYKKIFVQSDVLKSDKSRELSRSRINVELFITSGKTEYKSVKSNIYEYNGEVVLTGLPRFDKLEKNNSKKLKKTILIAPINSENRFLKLNSQKEKDAFKKSEYFKKWNSLLQNEQLLETAKSQGYEIAYLSHPYMKEINSLFNSKKVRLIDFSEQNHEIVNSSVCVITDQNPIYNDFAYAEKQIFHYIPDFDETSEEGYFNYATDGFGPVLEDEDSLVDHVIKGIENRFKVDQEYIDRKNRFFAFDDQNNCQRVYDEIKKLDRKYGSVSDPKSKMLWLALGENKLADKILERHGLKSFTTPYSQTKSNIDYAIALEKIDYSGLLQEETLYYPNKNNKSIVRSKAIVACDDIFNSMHQKGFEFPQDIINSQKQRKIFESTLNRMRKLKESTNEVCFLYFHRTNPNTNLDLLYSKMRTFLEFYHKNQTNKARVTIFTQKIIENADERTVVQKQLSNDIHFFEFHTLVEWKGNDLNYLYATIDDDLIEKMIEEMKLISKK